MVFPTPKAIVALICCGLAGGCAFSGNNYQRTAVSLPSAWQGGVGDPSAWPDREWWKGFQSSELDRLIADAQHNNHDLKAAAARIAEARAAARIAGAALYPALDLAAAVKRTKTSGKKPANYGVGPQASYEIDAWGANRLASDAAEDAVLSSGYAQEEVKLTLITNVATAYFQILSLNDRIAVARRTLANAVRLMDLVDAQKRAGKVSLFDVERQKIQVANTEAVLPPLLQQLQVTRDALAVLLGKNPGDVTVTTPSLQSLAVPTVPLGVPARILDRRPDIRRAEADLIAANANVSAARAAFMPKFTLGAQGGVESAQLRTLFEPGSGVYSISVDLLATIFDGGKRSGQVDLAMARRTELVEAYQKSIISGLGEVEDALAGVRQSTAEEKVRQESVTRAREADHLAELQLRAGAVDLTAVLDAERTLLGAETAADQVRLERFSSLVSLYRALGGGWREADIARNE